MTGALIPAQELPRQAAEPILRHSAGEPETETRQLEAPTFVLSQFSRLQVQAPALPGLAPGAVILSGLKATLFFSHFFFYFIFHLFIYIYGSYYVAHNGLKLGIFLAQTPDHRYI